MAKVFGPLQRDIVTIVSELSDDDLETIVDYLDAAGDAVERSIHRMRE